MDQISGQGRHAAEARGLIVSGWDVAAAAYESGPVAGTLIVNVSAPQKLAGGNEARPLLRRSSA